MKRGVAVLPACGAPQCRQVQSKWDETGPMELRAIADCTIFVLCLPKWDGQTAIGPTPRGGAFVGCDVLHRTVSYARACPSAASAELRPSPVVP